MVFSFYEWTFKDSWLAVLLSVITVLALLGVTLMFGIKASRQIREEIRPLFAPLKGSYKPSQRWFHWALLSNLFSKAVIVGFGQKNGTVQAAFFFTVELAMLLALAIYRPYPQRRTDAIAITFSAARVVSSGLLIPFITPIGVKPIPRVVIGLVSAVVSSVAIVIAFLDLLKSLIPWTLFRLHPRHSDFPIDSDYNSDLDSSLRKHEKQEV
jgi:hypothetical protein